MEIIGRCLGPHCTEEIIMANASPDDRLEVKHIRPGVHRVIVKPRIIPIPNETTEILPQSDMLTP